MEANVVAEVFSIIEKCEQEEEASSTQFGTIVKENASVLQHHFEQLYDVKYQLQNTNKTSNDLSALISSVKEVSEGVSAKIRQLHQTQVRVNQALEIVEGLIDIRSCLEGVETAIAKQEYERATDYVSKVLKLERNLSEESTAGKNYDGSFIEANMKKNSDVFKQAEKKIKDLVFQKFQESVTANDKPSIERFAKLFAPLGLEQEGLELYCDYCCSLVESELHSLLQTYLTKAGVIAPEVVESVQQKRKKRESVTYIDLITNILDLCADKLEEEFEAIRFFFGTRLPNQKLTSIYFIEKIQKVCDRAACKVLNDLIEKRNLHQFIKQAKQWNLLTTPVVQFLAQAASQPDKKIDTKNLPPDPRDIDLYLEEIAIFISRFEMYQNFVTSMVEDAYSASLNHSLNDLQKLEARTLICESEIEKKMPILTTTYIPLDEYFIRENIKKVIEPHHLYLQQEQVKYEKGDIHEFDYDKTFEQQESNQKGLPDEGDEEDGDTKYSAFVDDVFYVLRKSAARAFISTNPQLIITILNRINAILSGFVKEELVQPLQCIQKHQVNYIEKKSFMGIMLALNNLDVCSEYTVKMKQFVDKAITDDEVIRTEQDRTKVKSCSHDFTHTSTQYKELIRSYLHRLVQSYMKESLVNEGLSQFNFVNYNISESEFAFYENNDPFAQHFIQLVEEYLEEFETTLSINVMDVLIQEIVSITTLELEQMVFKKNFSLIGGLQFDKDIRTLLSYFSAKTQRTVRDKFARLNQIATILKVNKIQEVLEYWGESGMVILSSNEVRNVLLLRTQFNRELINKLNL